MYLESKSHIRSDHIRTGRSTPFLVSLQIQWKTDCNNYRNVIYYRQGEEVPKLLSLVLIIFGAVTNLNFNENVTGVPT